ncbi:MAG: hypothetical protein ACFFDH_03070 [Promethearchaeota archaeon]
MTICIAAKCENNTNIVAASDKLLTIRGLIEFDHPSSKIEKLMENCCIMTAGNALATTELFEDIKEEISEYRDITIRDIARITKEKYILHRSREIGERYLAARNINNIDEFYEKIMNLPPNIGMYLDDKIENYDFDLEVLIGGIDQNGAHIYNIVNPGCVNCFDSIGYCAIGSGEQHSILSLISYNYDPHLSTNSALYIIYEAKKIAEKAPGVGKETVLALLTDKGLYEISNTVIQELEDIYTSKKRLQELKHEELDKRIDELKII